MNNICFSIHNSDVLPYNDNYARKHFPNLRCGDGEKRAMTTQLYDYFLFEYISRCLEALWATLT